MNISIQYLEGGPHAARVSPGEARARLRAAFEQVPFAMVLLGWDLAPRVVEACAEECALHRSDLYLWQPLLVGHGPFRPDPAWRVIALDGRPAAGYGHKAEFSFICPNQPAARESILSHLSAAVAGGYYRGVFLDRIRFPSPAGDLVRQLGCFCDACQEAAREVDLDLACAQEELLRFLGTREGKQAAIYHMLSTSGAREPEGPLHSLDRLLAFRRQSIGAFVKQIADAAIAQGLKVGLDCYSPTLSLMVGQDLPELAHHCDWIKVMTYARAYGPASLPFEILGLANWLMDAAGESEPAALACLAEATGWPLPTCREEVRDGLLSASILTKELCRGRAGHAQQLLAGIEMVEIPGVAQLTPAQIRTDAEAVLAGAPDGVVLSWDLRHMPADRLNLANSLYLRVSNE